MSLILTPSPRSVFSSTNSPGKRPSRRVGEAKKVTYLLLCEPCRVPPKLRAVRGKKERTHACSTKSSKRLKNTLAPNIS